MTKKNDYELDMVSVRLVKDATLLSDKPVVSPEGAIQLMKEHLREMDRECVVVINLKTNGKPINATYVSIGGLASSLVIPREVLKASILSNAAHLVMMHNHPSGSITPSKEDITATKRMANICAIMDIPLVDHIIVAANTEEYYSFAKNGFDFNNTNPTFIDETQRKYSDSYVDPEIVKRAREADLFDVLKATGEPMVRKGSEYRLIEHDSLVITPGKGFYWFSRQYGSSSPIDFYMHVKNMPFVDAVKLVANTMSLEGLPAQKGIEEKSIAHPEEISEAKGIVLPERDENDKAAFAYLVKTRCLNPEIVSKFMRSGEIYQSKDYKNVVFIGKDFEGNVVSATKVNSRSFTEDDFFRKADVSGSVKDYRFRIENANDTVNVFESEIDLLSYYSMIPEPARCENFLSLGGVSEKALERFLENRSDIKHINICTDNDKAGHEFCDRVFKRYNEQYKVTREIPKLKDFNEDLCNNHPYLRRRFSIFSFPAGMLSSSKEEKEEYFLKNGDEKLKDGIYIIFDKTAYRISENNNKPLLTPLRGVFLLENEIDMHPEEKGLESAFKEHEHMYDL